MYKPITLARLRMAIRDLGKPAVTGQELTVSDPTPSIRSGHRQARPVLTAIVASPIDMHVIEELKLVSSRPDFFPNLLNEACNDIQRNVGHINEALAKRHYAAVRDAAHALKGVSGDVGAVRLVALATNLMAAPREDLETAHERWSADLAEATRITVQALRSEVTDGPRVWSAGTASSLHSD
jgi:two-component system sensor histidine kinase RpfC